MRDYFITRLKGVEFVSLTDPAIVGRVNCRKLSDRQSRHSEIVLVIDSVFAVLRWR